LNSNLFHIPPIRDCPEAVRWKPRVEEIAESQSLAHAPIVPASHRQLCESLGHAFVVRGVLYRRPAAARGQRISEAGRKPFLFLSPDAIAGREEDSSIFLINITLPRSAGGIIGVPGNTTGAMEGIVSAWKKRIQARSGHRHRFAPLG